MYKKNKYEKTNVKENELKMLKIQLKKANRILIKRQTTKILLN